MRVLYLLTSDVSSRFLAGQLAHLVDQGHEVHLGLNITRHHPAFDETNGVHHINFRRSPAPLQDASALMATIRLIRSLQPDIVNASTPKAGLLGMVAAWLCRVPRRIYVVRGLRFETLSGVQQLALRLLERVATAAATHVIYNSVSLRKLAEDRGAVRPGRGLVLAGGSGNGIDHGRFNNLPARNDCRRQLGIAEDARVVGFVGRLTNDKGVRDLIEAFRDPADDVIVLLVGDYEEGDSVAASTRELIATLDHTRHVPWVEDIRRIYPALDVLAFPSYREGLPNVPLEAQLCGVPVVGYAATGTVDAVLDQVDGNSLVRIGDRTALREQILGVLNGLPLRAGPSVSARWVRQNFAQTAIWSELEAIYSEPAGFRRRAHPPPVRIRPTTVELAHKPQRSARPNASNDLSRER